MRYKALAVALCLATSGAARDDRALGRVHVEVGSEDGSSQSVVLYEGSYALVVGVSDYKNGWKDLPGVRNDVMAVEAALKQAGFEVTTVLNPDKAVLEAAMDEFIADKAQYAPTRILFYFAGHGYTEKLSDGRQRGYIVASNAGGDPETNPGAFARGAISMERVRVWAEDIKANHALFVFDSCFAGTIFRSRSNPEIPRTIQTKVTRPVRQFISAGGPDETVPDESVFRQVFLQGICGDADMTKDGYVTGTELGEYLCQQVPEYSPGQTPDYGKLRNPALDGGDMVFLVGVNTPFGPVMKPELAAPPPVKHADNRADTGAVAPHPEPRTQAPFSPKSPRPKSDSTPSRFLRSSDGVISDSATGLEWILGPNVKMEYKEASQWAKKCSVAGGGWRMPTETEIITLRLSRRSILDDELDPLFTLPVDSSPEVFVERRKPSLVELPLNLIDPIPSRAYWFGVTDSFMDTDAAYVFAVRSPSRATR